MLTVTNYCYLSSPIHIADKNTSLIPPIRFKDKIYVIQERTFYEILTKIQLFQKYNLYVRENGYNNTYRWLNNIGLLNIGFLESVSNYSLEISNFKKFDEYSYFQKDCNSNPFISGEYLKNLFKKVFIYKFCNERFEEFNKYVNEEFNIIQQELSGIENTCFYDNRKQFYKNNIFSQLLENFLINTDSTLLKNLQVIENLNIYTESRLDTNDLGLYKVGTPISYKNSNYKLVNTRYQECLKNNTSFKLFIDFGYLSKHSSSESNFIEVLLENLKVLTEDKFSFDVRYIYKITQSTEKFNPALRNLNYNEIQHSNLLLCSSNLINATIAALNFDSNNLETINSLIFERQNELESKLVKLSFENDLYPYYSLCGYAKIHTY